MYFLLHPVPTGFGHFLQHFLFFLHFVLFCVKIHPFLYIDLVSGDFL